MLIMKTLILVVGDADGHNHNRIHNTRHCYSNQNVYLTYTMR